jgi:hypothetical protein
MTTQNDDRRAERLAQAARFPLELLVIAAVGAFTYGRALIGCSSSSSPPSQSSTSSSSSSAGGSTSASSTSAGGR